MEKPNAGDLFRMYTGSVCRVICVAHQTESSVEVVVVHPVPDDGTRLAIPADVFSGRVFSNGVKVPRFTKVKQH